MNNEKTLLTPEQKHQRQAWLEIWLPMIIIIGVALALFTLLLISAFTGNSDLSQWSATSVILLLIPFLLIGVVVCALVIYLSSWVGKGNRALPKYGKIARDKVNLTGNAIQNGALTSINIVLRINHFVDQVQKFFQSVLHPQK